MATALWRAGELRWKLDDHQLEVYDAFHAWDAYRQTPEYTALVIREGASLDSVWAEEIARRVGKTFKWLVILFELSIKRDGAVFTYGTAYEKDIGEIIVPLAEIISRLTPVARQLAAPYSFANASSAAAMWSSSSADETCTRSRAWPLGTTG